MKIRKKVKKAESNTLPLMDCMFILLIYFIFSMLSMTIHAGLTIKLPENTQEEILSSKVQSIHLQENETILYNKKPISLSNLRTELWNKQLEKEVEVYITSEKKASYQNLIAILDLLRDLSITKIAIETDIKQ